MKNKTLFSAIIISASTAAILLTVTILPSYGQDEEEKLAYLPQIRLDPSPTPTVEPTATLSCIFADIDSADESIEDSVASEIQAHRRDNNIAELTRLDSITAAARGHSEDMAQNNFVDHQGSDGRYGPARLRENCYNVTKDQEIIWAGSFSNATALINLWIEDPNFGPALLDDEMKDFGVGYMRTDSPVEGNGGQRADYFTVSFGTTIGGRQVSGQTCQIELKNEFGHGVLITSNPEICANANR